MRTNRPMAALVGLGVTAALLLPISDASADPGRGRPVGPKVRYSARHDNGRKVGHNRKAAQHRRDNRRDSYRDGYKAGRRDNRNNQKKKSNDTLEDIGLVIGGAILGAIIANN
ncbi:MAG TPA: hypothetical protein GX715_12795 [Armatimonadetes bacterium]|jgi:hypothetical protein|nr:hypothetical protein [Armatimonadota bacterium]